MNTRAKGSRLEAKSIAWLRADGATLVFRGKGVRRSAESDGVAQVDLIAFYVTSYARPWSRLVEVTVPTHRGRARKRLVKLLKTLKSNPPVFAEVHVWKPRAKEPEREEVST